MEKATRDPSSHEDEVDNIREEEQPDAKRTRVGDSVDGNVKPSACWDDDLFKLQKAVHARDFQSVQEVVEKGYDLNDFHFGGQGKNTALHEACHYGCGVNIMRLLVDHGVDIHAKDENGATALHLACRFMNSNSEVAKLLIDKGVAVAAVDRDGSTALHWACHNANMKIVKKLVDKGAPVDVKDSSGDTPLHLVYMNRRYGKVIKFLVEKGADPNAKNLRGMTPLHRATGAVAELESIKALVEAGSDPNLADNDGETPLHCACQYDFMSKGRSKVQLLLNLGASLHEKCKTGLTPLHVASRENHLDIVWCIVRGHPHLLPSG